MDIPGIANFFDLKHTDYSDIYEGLQRPWNAVTRIQAVLESNLRPGVRGKVQEGAKLGSEVFIGSGTVVESGATVKGPAIIGEDCEIRSGAYIRSRVIVGDGCVIGNSSELKNALLHDEVEVPHFSYVGDSVMGWRSHLGAGTIFSNLKVNRDEVSVRIGGEKVDTGLRKLGAVIGDQVEIGCNCVLNPGTLIEKNTLSMPCVSLSGHYPANSFIKLRQQTTVVERNSGEEPASDSS